MSEMEKFYSETCSVDEIVRLYFTPKHGMPDDWELWNGFASDEKVTADFKEFYVAFAEADPRTCLPTEDEVLPVIVEFYHFYREQRGRRN